MQRKDVTIKAPTAIAMFDIRRSLFDPEQPTKDPNQLLAELGGERALRDPTKVNWNCPLCYRTMRWELFQAHAPGCIRQYGSLLDPTLKQYRGVDIPKGGTGGIRLVKKD